MFSPPKSVKNEDLTPMFSTVFFLTVQDRTVPYTLSDTAVWQWLDTVQQITLVTGDQGIGPHPTPLDLMLSEDRQNPRKELKKGDSGICVTLKGGRNGGENGEME